MARKKNARTMLRKLLDRLWQQFIVARAGGLCELCGKPARCGHHIFTKASSLRLRWDPRNGVAVCNGCHIGCHGSRYAEFLSRIQDRIGMAAWNALRRKHGNPIKLTMDDLRKTKKRLERGLDGANI